MTDLTGLSVAQASGLLGEREVSARELLDAHLAKIAQDGPPSFDGRPDTVNAFMRVYEEDARAAAERADKRLSAAAVADQGPAPALCGIPMGLKDLYAVAGKPLTASSRAVRLAPEADCDVWTRLASNGAVLVGHLHTHECAAGGSTDQVGNPWALDRTAGGSSGGSAAALAAGFAGADLEADPAHLRQALEPSHLEQDLPVAPWSLGIEPLHDAAHHQLHELVRGRGRVQPGGGRAAVRQHRNAVPIRRISSRRCVM